MQTEVGKKRGVYHALGSLSSFVVPPSPWSCSQSVVPLLLSAEEDKAAPCRDDAMIVFDASGSMSGNQTLGIPNSQARIDEVRSALAQVLPSVTRLRKVGLISFGPGPWNQCNVQLNLKPTPMPPN